MRVKLPGNRSIVIDSKVSLKSYEDALKTTKETERKAFLKLYSTQIKVRVRVMV
jgi:DNA anti-recombination protein RmuC